LMYHEAPVARPTDSAAKTSKRARDGTGLGDTVVGDGDSLATVRLGHDAVGQSKDKLGETVVGGVAVAGVSGQGGSVVESDVTNARRSISARAAVAR